MYVSVCNDVTAVRVP